RTLGLTDHVFQVQSHGAGGHDCLRSLRHIRQCFSVTGLHVSPSRNAHRTRNPLHNFQHFVARNPLSVRITQCKRHTRAGRRDRRISQFLQHPSAPHIPSIRKHQHAPPPRDRATAPAFRNTHPRGPPCNFRSPSAFRPCAVTSIRVLLECGGLVYPE